MDVRLTQTYRARLADALTGAAAGPLSIGPGKLGNASAGRAAQDAMYTAAGAQVPTTTTVTRNAQQEVLVLVTLPAGHGDVTCDELGIFAADGALLLHATFPQQTISSGVQAAFDFTFNPEVYSG